MKIFLVSCVKIKQSVPCEAGKMYTSDWFKKAKAYTKKHCDEWYILSAKYGLLRPDEIVTPYEETLLKKRKVERLKWADMVITDLYKIISPQDEVTILAGLNYREFLTPWLEERGNKVIIPLEGLAIGKQKRWFNENK
ncbi:DUF6884 domain-containing protein [Maridesulfovibrio ferrireducens]|uniref:DUF6884 domain-containing protein n=1 Tax=Maridesulfovibrio ferrireducens TaxID=246191 RepID=UPI001A2F9BE1|nr:DUF6884 domain-containing protein [Maridesulfovibrio ferrireducens]MBI9110646.1 hypothetical protein [Maridesulfovibrio ferrireducens]